MAGRTLTVYLAADTDRFRSGMNRAGQDASGLRGRLSRLSSTMTGMLGPAMAGAAVAAGAFAVKLGVDGVKAAIADEERIAKLTKVMENFGLANDTTRVNEMIDAMQRQVGVSEEELTPAFIRLLSATGDTNQALDLLSLGLDISAASGKSLDMAAKSLGRALEGSYGGLAKLGVGLSASEIKAAGLEGTIGILQERFKGTAVTIGETTSGQVKRLGIAFEELQEAFGAGFLEGLDGAEGGVGNLSDSLHDMEDTVTSVGEDIGSFVTMIGTVASGFTDATGALDDFRKAVDDPKWNALAKVIEQAFVPLSIRISDLVDNIRYLTGTAQPGQGNLTSVDLGNWQRPVNLGGGGTTPPLLGGNRTMVTEQAVGSAISNIIAKTDARSGYVVGGVLR